MAIIKVRCSWLTEVRIFSFVENCKFYDEFFKDFWVKIWEFRVVKVLRQIVKRNKKNLFGLVA
jgi:hypothetical protein